MGNTVDYSGGIQICNFQSYKGYDSLTVCNFQSKFKHCLPMLVRSLCTSFMKIVLGMLKQKWVGQKDRQKDRKRVNT